VASDEHRCFTESASSARFLPPETLIYARGKALVAQRLDVSRGELVGEPFPLGVELPRNLSVGGLRALTAARDAVAYQVGVEEGNRLVWVDRSGAEKATGLKEQGWLYSPRLSPDGERFSVSSYGQPGGDGQIWVVDPARNNETRMTFEDRDDQVAVWSPDGRTLALTSFGGVGGVGGSQIWLMDSGRPRSEDALTSVGDLVSVDTWLPNGEALLVTRLGSDSRQDIWSVERRSGSEPKPLLATPSNEHSPNVSPDGEWLAYVSDESGRDEVYVRRLAGGDEVWRISTDGGSAPLWRRRDGRELYFIDPGNRLCAAAVTLGASFSAAAPVPVALVLRRINPLIAFW